MKHLRDLSLSYFFIISEIKPLLGFKDSTSMGFKDQIFEALVLNSIQVLPAIVRVQSLISCDGVLFSISIFLQ